LVLAFIVISFVLSSSVYIALRDDAAKWSSRRSTQSSHTFDDIHFSRAVSRPGSSGLP
jgi:hypothetical protein